MKKIWFVVIFTLLTSNLLFAQEFNFRSSHIVKDHYFEEIPFEFIKNKIYIPVFIDNIKYRFLLDTGSPTIVSESLFNKLKPTETLQGDMTDINNKKINDVSHFYLSRLKIGNIEFNNVATTLMRNVAFMECSGFDGIIGSNLFYNSTLSICFNKGVIIITDKIKKLNIKNKYKWIFKMPVNRCTPIISVKLRGLKGKGFFGDFIFDTGSPNLISISKDYADFYKSKGILSHEIESWGCSSYGFAGLEDNGIQQKWQVSSLSINKEKILGVSVRSIRSAIHSQIGCELVKYGDVTLDFKNKSFAFEPYAENAEHNKTNFPVSFALINEKLVVGIVWDKNIDVSQGDQVIEIDDISYENVSVCNILFDTVLEGKGEVKLKLKKKSGEVKIVTIRKH